MEVGRRPIRIGPLLGFLLAGTAVASIFVPRALDYAFGVVFLVGAVRGLWASSRRPPEERSGWQWGPFHPVALVGLCGLFGGGSIAWGWLTAARAAAGVAGLAILAQAAAWRRLGAFDFRLTRLAAQSLQRLRSDLAHLAPQLSAEAPQVMPYQQRQIVSPLAQGRQMDGEHAPTVEWPQTLTR